MNPDQKEKLYFTFLLYITCICMLLYLIIYMNNNDNNVDYKKLINSVLFFHVLY